MEGLQASSAKLDNEFDLMLVEMRPHVLKLPHKSGKFFVYKWAVESSQRVISGVCIE